MSKNNYFEEIGMWPRGAHRMGSVYAIGFIGSLVLTLGSYVLAVQHLASASVLVPIVLIFACLQFILQVVNFLHVSGEPFSRERLIVLGCTGVIMLIIVLGSMWIMTNLNARMNAGDDMTPQQRMEMYMMNEQGI